MQRALQRTGHPIDKVASASDRSRVVAGHILARMSGLHRNNGKLAGPDHRSPAII